MKFQAPRGTYDILPDEVHKWHYLEKIIRKNAKFFNYKEIRFPIFERLELFQRGVGKSTDIVEKEMYVFKDKKGRNFALRPEGTASIVRAYIEHNMNSSKKNPLRLFYFGPMFRYARPQKGRYRQFYQFGFEYIGNPEPIADAEIIAIGWKIYQDMKIPNVNLELNSVGCVNCRRKYYKELKKFLIRKRGNFCSVCQKRMNSNPMRTFDCKNKNCQNLLNNAPIMLENLCPECESHFQKVLDLLNQMNVKYNVNSKIVRGLDYYTRTAFEYKIEYLGAQDAIGGGGRYDELIEYLGGKSTPAVGLSGGLERIILSLNEAKIDIQNEESLDVFIIPLEEKFVKISIEIMQKLHKKSISSIISDSQTSLKNNLKYCDENRVKFAIIIGENEIKSKEFTIKNINEKSQKKIPTNEVCEYIFIQLKNN
ncbi:MAG: histidine--tRNA ligase [Candidatus Cloacimonetes bacterium]|nr:histidine--tRNA ligase [Candidatus Cloacimonadota bacterium]